MNEIKELIEKLTKFRDDRNWKQFHSPENLAKSIAIEASELLINFQWGSQNTDINNIKEEVADIFSYLLLLCKEFDIDLLEATANKIKLNNKKYPIKKAFGNSKKYNKL